MNKAPYGRPGLALLSKIALKKRLDRFSKWRFLTELKDGAAILDVGCGGHSPYRTKAVNKTFYYTGIDIQLCHFDQRDEQLADEFHIVPAEDFASAIAALGCRFDALISSHNIEHVEAPAAVLRSLCAVLRPGGTMYLSFPSEESVKFPPRRGTLNFHDDPTHQWLPVHDEIVDLLNECEVEIKDMTIGNRAGIPFVLGGVVEPLSAALNKVLPFTWNYWGFETVILGMKR